MRKCQETQSIVDYVNESGYISERSISLLKRRSQSGEKIKITARLNETQFKRHLSKWKNENM